MDHVALPGEGRRDDRHHTGALERRTHRNQFKRLALQDGELQARKAQRVHPLDEGDIISADQFRSNPRTDPNSHIELLPPTRLPSERAQRAFSPQKHSAQCLRIDGRR